MSEIALEFDNRIILSTGEVVAPYETLVELAREGINFSEVLTMPDPLVDKYNRISSTPLIVWDGNDIPSKPDRLKWNTPEEYREIDIYEYIGMCIEVKAENDPIYLSEPYIQRVKMELEEVKKLNFEPVIRHIIFLVDHFRTNKVVWGVGRGSSCASLILFLVGLNKIDPVKYDIPMNEFFKDNDNE